MGSVVDDASSRHTIPVIDRMMDVLGELEHQEGGLGIRALTDALKLPRTTIYRILNTLHRHGMVWRDEAGAYHLGRRLLALAAHVAARVSDLDLAAICQPRMDRLAGELGEGVKLSVIDQQSVLVLAAAPGRREYALTVAPGQRLPIHAGAAGKLLLAHLPRTELDELLSRPLAVFTGKTITNPKRLKAELSRIKRQGWARDLGEHAASIMAFAAPVFSKSGKLEAALSVPFLAGAEPRRMEQIRQAAIAAANEISEAMPAD